MAYVAINDKLKDGVSRAIGGFRDIELKPLKEPSEIQGDIAKDPAVRALLQAAMWEPVKDLEERLRPYNRKYSVLLCLHEADSANCNISFRVDKVEGPCTALPANAYYMSDPVPVMLKVEEHPLFGELVQATNNKTEVTERWKAVAAQVKSFLSSCKSLNEAIKLWPDVVRYVPVEYLERASAKTVKAEAKESNALAALRAMDMDRVTTSMVLARMAGANV